MGINLDMNYEFLRVKDIETCFDNYENKLFLTFDIDWASDEVLNFTVDFLEKQGVCATFFVTHETPVLKRIRNNPKFELGIHPNFNFLLNGDFRYGKNPLEVIEYYLNMVPDAISVRCHSVTYNSQILDTLFAKGLKYDLNIYLPRRSGIPSKPILFPSYGMTRLPYFWEDDDHFLYNENPSPDLYLGHPGLKIFDFHPIHVFLNTEHHARYDNARNDLKNFQNLQTHVNKNSPGTKLFLDNLVKKALEK
jgi:hypothetical protein